MTLIVEGLVDRLNRYPDQIARVRAWIDPNLRLNGELPAEHGSWPEGV